MSQATVAIPIPPERRGLDRLTGAVSDSFAMTWRNVITLRRVPQLLVFSTVQPVMFVLLFVYVFGGAIQNASGLPYVDYLIPGIFVQMSVFGAMGTAVGLAADVKSGLLERFHALPMARSAVLAGRSTADVVRNVFVMPLVSGVGFLVGFRVQTDALGYLAGVALVLMFGYSLSWGSGRADRRQCLQPGTHRGVGRARHRRPDAEARRAMAGRRRVHPSQARASPTSDARLFGRRNRGMWLTRRRGRSGRVRSRGHHRGSSADQRRARPRARATPAVRLA